MKIIPKFVLPLFLFIAVAAGVSSCKTSKLAPDGAYNPSVTNAATGEVTSKPDFALFAADTAFDFAYKTVDKIFLFEQQNRDALWSISHNIKHTLDKARPQAVDIVKRYSIARRVYVSFPTPENLNAIQSILSELQRISTAVQTALPK